jgi:retron-type reverse transcriptase
VISPILTNIYLDKLDRKLESLCQQCSHGKWRKQSPKYVTLMKQRKQLLEQGETNPMLRESLKDPCRDLNKRILQTPGYDYHDPNYSRVKFLRYADDVVIGVIGPRSLAEQIKEEWARYLKEDLKQGLNQQKTLITHLTTEKVQFLGYAFKTTGSRLRKRNLKRQGLPYNVIQTSKTGCVSRQGKDVQQELVLRG